MMLERIPEAELREMQEREEDANTSPGLEVTNKNPLMAWCVRQLTETGEVVVGIASFEMKADAVFDFHARTDQPRLRIALTDAYAEIDILERIVAKKAPNQFEWNMFCDDMNNAFEEDVEHFSDGVRKLRTEINTQADEMQWYRSLKIERQEGGITEIDGGRKAQMLHEMWEENVRLKAELEKRPGLSREDTADLFGGKMMNAVQQGVELLARAKQIDTQAERIEALEKVLLEACGYVDNYRLAGRIDALLSKKCRRKMSLTDLKYAKERIAELEKGLRELKYADAHNGDCPVFDSQPCTCMINEHNARIDALLLKEKSDA